MNSFFEIRGLTTCNTLALVERNTKTEGWINAYQWSHKIWSVVNHYFMISLTQNRNTEKNYSKPIQMSFISQAIYINKFQKEKGCLI